MKEYQIELTDSEWMDLIDGSENRDNNLGICCANISALRDEIIKFARNGGRCYEFELIGLKQKIGWVIDGHDITGINALVKLCDQLDINISEQKHVKEHIE